MSSTASGIQGSAFLPALRRLKGQFEGSSPYDPPGLSGDPDGIENADWTPSSQIRGSSPSPGNFSSLRTLSADPYAPPVSSPSATANRGWSPYDPNGSAPPSMPPQSAPTMPVQPSYPDINRDVYLPQLQSVTQKLTDAYAPPQVGTGKAILGAIVGGITKNPTIGGLITGETQRQRQIQALTGQEQSLAGAIQQNRAATTADLNNQNTQADISLRGAQTDYYRTHANVLENPPEKPSKAQIVYDKATNPVGYQDENGNFMAPDNPALPEDVKKILGAAKAKPGPAESSAQDTQRAEGIRQKQFMKQPISPEDTAFLKAHDAEKTLVPTTNFNLNQGNKNSTRSDRSFQYNQTALDKVRQPIDQLAQRFSRLTDTLNQKSPQADALVGPELLSVMAGGQGSGIRLNEAEISRIVGGRSAWQDLQAKIQHWSTNPEDARSITTDQDKQIRDLISAVGTKMTAKQKAIDDAQNALLDTDDPSEHRRIVARAKSSLDSIDSGGGGKTYTDSDIRAAVEAHPGLTAAQADAAFKSKGWSKQ